MTPFLSRLEISMFGRRQMKFKSRDSAINTSVKIVHAMRHFYTKANPIKSISSIIYDNHLLKLDSFIPGVWVVKMTECS